MNQTPVLPILDVIPVAPLPRRPAPLIEDAILVAAPAMLKPGPVLDVVPVEAPEIPVLELADKPNIFVRMGRGIASACGWLFGVLSLIAGLAVLAAIPIVQFVTLGYMLEVGGRIARTGRLRNGFVGVRKAARVGSLVLGTSLTLAPLYLVSAQATAAQLIDPTSPAARGWDIGLTALMVVVLLHIVGAWSRGGRLHHFFWPSGNPITLIRRLFHGEWLDVLGLVCLGNFWWLGRRLCQGGYYASARDAVWDFVVSLRLPYYFWLGLRGFGAGLAWLVVPVTLLAIGRQAPVVGFLGGFLMIVVFLYVPFVQMRLARDQSFLAGMNLRGVRRDFRRAPVAFAFAFFFTLLLSLPLFFFKIEMIPRDGAFLMTPFFILSMWPARFLTGWAYARATRRDLPRHWFFRWSSRLFMLPVAAIFVFFVYFSQFTSWYGIWSLYDQHTFLLPVPFFDFGK